MQQPLWAARWAALPGAPSAAQLGAEILVVALEAVGVPGPGRGRVERGRPRMPAVGHTGDAARSWAAHTD